MHDLEFTGNSLIEDPSTKTQEKIEFRAPISTCQIVMSLGEEYATWGSLYPRINIDQVQLQVEDSLISVSAFGDLPLYKSHEFEASVKKWFVSQLSKRQADFKTQLQEAESNLWDNVPFSRKFFNGVTLNTSLSESLKFQGDYVVASFINEFDSSLDYSDFEKQLVTANPQFSNANEFRRDVQMTVDENLINHFLMGMFYAKKVYSLTDLLLHLIPENMQTMAKAFSNFFTSTTFAPVFPQLQREVGFNKRVDFRCGFSKQFMDDKLDDTHISQIWFKNSNRLEYALHFGCAVVYNSKTSNINPLSILKSLDTESPDW
jgi:hypothetical protein